MGNRDTATAAWDEALGSGSGCRPGNIMQHFGVEDFPQSLESGVIPGRALSCPAAGSIHISIVWG